MVPEWSGTSKTTKGLPSILASPPESLINGNKNLMKPGLFISAASLLLSTISYSQKPFPDSKRRSKVIKSGRPVVCVKYWEVSKAGPDGPWIVMDLFQSSRQMARLFIRNFRKEY